MNNIINLKKTVDEIRQTVLTNIVKMLTERKWLDENNLNANIKKILSQESDDFTYNIVLDNPKTVKQCVIRLYNQKITSVSKQSNISEFLKDYKDSHKIIVVEEITTKTQQHIFNNYDKTEIFLERSMMVNLVDNIYTSRYIVIPKDSEQYKQFFSEFQCRKKDMPKILHNDPAARYYNLDKYDIVRVIRASETSGLSSTYKIIV